jgi:rubrerythrin
VGGEMMDADTLFRAFKIAMEREHEATEFYSDLASKITEEDLKKLFQQFAVEETKHFNKLAELYKSLKDKIPDRQEP